MTKATMYSNHRNCGRCGKLVRQGSDFLRAQLHGTCVLFHWACFIALMRENNQPNADAKERSGR